MRWQPNFQRIEIFLEFEWREKRDWGDGMRETLQCPEEGCEREIAAELVAPLGSAALLMRSDRGRCPMHGEVRRVRP